MSQTSKKRKKRKVNNKQEIINTLVLIVSILVFAAIAFGSKMGFFGKYIGGLFFILFGYSAYIFPLLFLFYYFIFALGKFRNNMKKKAIMGILLYISSMILLATFFDKGANFQEKIANSNNLAKAHKGAGIIATSMHFVAYKLMGNVGIYLSFFIILPISLVVFFDYKFSDICKKIKESIKKIQTNMKNKKKNKKKKEKIIANNNIQKDEKPSDNIKLVDSEEITINSHDEKTNDIKELTDLDLENSKQVELEDFEMPVIEEVEYIRPPMELLKTFKSKGGDGNDILLENASTIEKTLKSFSIEAEVVTINRGPTVTSYELKPQPGIKVSRIVNLSNDLSLALATSGIRIEAPIPGKPYVGIEVPNKSKDMVSLKELIVTDDFQKDSKHITVALGRNISGQPIIANIDQMPHVLVAGATGSGKSVCINTIIMSIIYKYSPDNIRLMLIDPKIVELSVYNGIPHLLAPVVTDPKKSANALSSVVTEMVRRFKLFSKNNCRDIGSYNTKAKEEDLEYLPFIVVIIDELSDLMMEAPTEIEDYITRLAQMGRASGIHLIIATQRPSVDVITGTIKANIPSRISFQVSSQIDSRTILDMAGAEKLLGKGDMLYHPADQAKPMRVQGAFVSEKEVENVVDFISNKNDVEYSETIVEEIEKAENANPLLENTDELLSEAIEFVITEEQASISAIQRRFRVGYARAGRIVDQMEAMGIISGHEGSKPRRILVDSSYLTKDKEGNEDVI